MEAIPNSFGQLSSEGKSKFLGPLRVSKIHFHSHHIFAERFNKLLWLDSGFITNESLGVIFRPNGNKIFVIFGKFRIIRELGLNPGNGE